MTDFRLALARLVDRWPEIEPHELVSALRDEADRREAMAGIEPGLWHFNKTARDWISVAADVWFSQARGEQA